MQKGPKRIQKGPWGPKSPRDNSSGPHLVPGTAKALKKVTHSGWCLVLTIPRIPFFYVVKWLYHGGFDRFSPVHGGQRSIRSTAWLVVDLHLWKNMKGSVGMMKFPIYVKHCKTCSKPPTRLSNSQFLRDNEKKHNLIFQRLFVAQVYNFSFF